MTDKQLESILNAAKEELKMVLKTDDDVKIGYKYLTNIITLLQQPIIVMEVPGLGNIISLNNMPIYSKEFCDVLRVVANVLEATGEIRRRKIEEGK